MLWIQAWSGRDNNVSSRPPSPLSFGPDPFAGPGRWRSELGEYRVHLRVFLDSMLPSPPMARRQLLIPLGVDLYPYAFEAGSLDLLGIYVGGCGDEMTGVCVASGLGSQNSCDDSRAGSAAASD